jgi:hypothetical protein
MRAIAILGLAAISCAGCGLETSDEEPAEARENLTFSLWERGHIGPTKFHVSQGGNVTVTITGFHLHPIGCNKTGAANLILIERKTPPVELAPRSLVADGKTKVETWNALAGGDYELALDTRSQNPYCHWVGDVFTQST